MYRLIKPQGYDVNVSLENTDTKATILLGRVNASILAILVREGIDYPGTVDEWYIEVNKEIAQELITTGYSIVKPIRDQRKKPEERKEENKKIDAMDVMLGLASYR